MALIKCVECGREISSKALSCPHCGCPIEHLGRLIPEGSDKNKDIVRALFTILEKNKLIYKYVYDVVYNKGKAEYLKFLEYDTDDDYFEDYEKNDKIMYSWQTIHPFIGLFKHSLSPKLLANISEFPEEEFKIIENFYNSIERDLAPIVRYAFPANLVTIIKLKKISDKAVNDYESVRPTKYFGEDKNIYGINLYLVQAYRYWYVDNKDVILSLSKNDIKSYLSDEDEVDKAYDYIHNELYDYLFEDIRDREVMYLLNNAFNEMSPTMEEDKGSYDLSLYVQNKYKIDDNTLDEICGYINFEMSSLDHSEMLFGNRRSDPMLTSAGKKLRYSSYKYVDEKKDSKVTWDEYDENYFNTNMSVELKECIKYMINEANEKEKKYDYFAKCTMDELKAAKIKEDNTERIKALKDKELRDKVVDYIVNTPLPSNPNYVKGAVCPNCGSHSVKKISGLKSIASVSLFGLASKNIGKTMECTHCGYKW